MTPRQQDETINNGYINVILIKKTDKKNTDVIYKALQHVQELDSDIIIINHEQSFKTFIENVSPTRSSSKNEESLLLDADIDALIEHYPEGCFNTAYKSVMKIHAVHEKTKFIIYNIRQEDVKRWMYCNNTDQLNIKLYGGNHLIHNVRLLSAQILGDLYAFMIERNSGGDDDDDDDVEQKESDKRENSCWTNGLRDGNDSGGEESYL